jgi:hypothetical protein
MVHAGRMAGIMQPGKCGLALIPMACLPRVGASLLMSVGDAPENNFKTVYELSVHEICVDGVAAAHARVQGHGRDQGSSRPSSGLPRVRSEVQDPGCGLAAATASAGSSPTARADPPFSPEGDTITTDRATPLSAFSGTRWRPDHAPWHDSVGFLDVTVENIESHLDLHLQWRSPLAHFRSLASAAAEQAAVAPHSPASGTREYRVEPFGRVTVITRGCVS